MLSIGRMIREWRHHLAAQRPYADISAECDLACLNDRVAELEAALREVERILHAPVIGDYGNSELKYVAVTPEFEQRARDRGFAFVGWVPNTAGGLNSPECRWRDDLLHNCRRRDGALLDSTNGGCFMEANAQVHESSAS